MTERNRADRRKYETSDRGKRQGREDSRFGLEDDANDDSSYGSDRNNHKVGYSQRFNQDDSVGRRYYGDEQDDPEDHFSFQGSEYDRGSSPFRSENDSTRQFQSTVSPFRKNRESSRKVHTKSGGGSRAGREGENQRTESMYGRDEPYQGNELVGGFGGRGPKGYERSDEKIKEDVCDCLSDDDNIDASEIEVSVSKGEVTLTGTVSERRAKRLAEDAIEHIKGVKDVLNQIRVQSYGSEKMSFSSLPNKDEGSNTSERPTGQKQLKPTNNDGQLARH